MALTAAQLQQIRHHVPKEWTPLEKFNDGAVSAAFNQYGTVLKTALALSELKLSHMVENPDTFSIPGEYSQSNASGVAALRAKIVQLSKQVIEEDAAANATASSYQMERVGGPKR